MTESVKALPPGTTPDLSFIPPEPSFDSSKSAVPLSPPGQTEPDWLHDPDRFSSFQAENFPLSDSPLSPYSPSSLDNSRTSRHRKPGDSVNTGGFRWLSEGEHEHRTLICEHCGHSFKVLMDCGDRTCPVCRRKWFGRHFKPLLRCMETWKRRATLTLTLKNVPDQLFTRKFVGKLRKCLSKLLHRKYFKQRISGGFYVVQATNKGKGWHLHLHVVFEGDFIDQETISKAWREITKDSYIVWVKNLVSSERALAYLLSDFQGGAPRIRPQDQEQYNLVFKGSRLVQGFGKYAKFKLEKNLFPCPVCGSTDCWCPFDQSVVGQLEWEDMQKKNWRGGMPGFG